MVFRNEAVHNYEKAFIFSFPLDTGIQGHAMIIKQLLSKYRLYIQSIFEMSIFRASSESEMKCPKSVHLFDVDRSLYYHTGSTEKSSEVNLPY